MNTFVLYTFLISTFWCYFLFILITQNNHQTWSPGILTLLYLFATWAENGDPKDRDITKKDLYGFIFIIAFIAFLFNFDIDLKEHLLKPTTTSLLLVMSGAIWSHQVNRAWQKDKKLQMRSDEKQTHQT